MVCQNCGAQNAGNSGFCIACGNKLQPAAGSFNAVPQPPSLGAGAMEYATWANRAIGYLIDTIFVFALMGVLYLVLGGMLGALAHLGGEQAGSAICCLGVILFPLSTVLVGLYNRVYLISQRGYSIGQGVVKIKVVDASGNLLTQGTAVVRLLVQAAFGLIPFLPLLDLLWPLWDDRRQTLHDKAVNCYVINM